MYRFFGILVLIIVLCSCSTTGSYRAPDLDEVDHSPTSDVLINSTLENNTPQTVEPTHISPVPVSPVPYPDISLRDVKTIASYESNEITITQIHYELVFDGIKYEGSSIEAKTKLRQHKWSLDFLDDEKGQYDEFRPFISGIDRIYTLSGVIISAHEINSGNQLWEIDLGGAVNSGVEDINGVVYVSCIDGPTMTAITSDGEIKWQVHYVYGYGEPYNVRLIDDRIIVSMFGEYDDHDVYFDYDGNYEVRKRLR